MQKKTYIAFVLDTSGSMSEMREAAIAMFNEQRDTIHRTRKDGGRTRASLILFGLTGGHSLGEVKVIHDNEKTRNIPTLTGDTYRPQGLTPMRDGVGKAIKILSKHDDGGKDTAFLVIVITDGLENHSSKWSAERLSKRVTKLQNTGRWTFVIYGAENLDLAELQETAGLGSVPDGNISTFVPDSGGVHQASAALSVETTSYMSDRIRGNTATTTFSDDPPVEGNKNVDDVVTEESQEEISS